MPETSEMLVDEVRRLMFIREETRFELGVLHDRINALISAEAFLMIAFTMALGNANDHWGSTTFRLVAPILSALGFTLSVMAWPGIDTSFRTVIGWNSRLLDLLDENPGLTEAMWRTPVLRREDRRADLDRRSSMLFARAVPAAFAVAWAVLTIFALVLPTRT